MQKFEIIFEYLFLFFLFFFFLFFSRLPLFTAVSVSWRMKIDVLYFVGKRADWKCSDLQRQENESSLTELTRAAGIGKLCKQMGRCCIHTLLYGVWIAFTQEVKISLKTMLFHNFPGGRKIAFHHFISYKMFYIRQNDRC